MKKESHLVLTSLCCPLDPGLWLRTSHHLMLLKLVKRKLPEKNEINHSNSVKFYKTLSRWIKSRNVPQYNIQWHSLFYNRPFWWVGGNYCKQPSFWLHLKRSYNNVFFYADCFSNYFGPLKITLRTILMTLAIHKKAIYHSKPAALKIN